MDRTVKFFEDNTEVISRYTGSHFTYIRGKIFREIKQFGDGKVTKFTVSVSNGKDKDGNWKHKTFYDCTAFGDRGKQIMDRYSSGDEIELFAKFSKLKSGDKYFYGFNVIDVPRMKPADSSNPDSGEYVDDDSLPF